MRRARVWVVREEAGQARVLGSGSECVTCGETWTDNHQMTKENTQKRLELPPIFFSVR